MISIIDEKTLHEFCITPHECHMDFKVYSIGLCKDGSCVYIDKESGSMGADNRDNAEVFMEGSIKWDGCINFTFPAQEDCMLHACGLNGYLNAFAGVGSKLYAMASEYIPNWYK